MSIAAYLLVYSLAVIVLGPSLLGFLTRSGHAPKSGVAAWLIAIGSVILTGLASVLLVISDVIAHWRQHNSIVVSCIRFVCDLAAGREGLVPQVLLTTILGAVVVGIAMVGIRFILTIARLRIHAHGHSRAVRMVGRPTAEPGVYVVDAAERTAYCVGGKPPTIVVTTATLDALASPEVKAVLAHERAHLDGHHLLIVTLLRGLAAALPRLRLVTRGALEVPRLLEMCADDVAARRHGRGPLLAGLLALAGGAPAAAMGAADVAALTRAERLAVPPAHSVRVRAQAALTSAATIIAVAPLGTLMLAASGIFVCSG